MMAITPTFLDGRLDIVGDAANDTVVISTVNVGGVPHVTVNGLGIGPGVPAAAVTSIVADLGAGNDIMNLSTLNTATFSGLTNGSVTLRGGVGNDNLTGTSLADTLIGGDNNDILVGGAGNDIIEGGNANDTLNGGDGDDQLTGGNGIDSYQYTGSGQLGSDTLVESPTDNLEDTLHFAGLGGPVTVDLALTTPQVIRPGLLTITLSSGTAFERIEGTGFADMLYGNSRNNYINGANGNDLIWGRDGADNLLGGAGDDSIYGEGGNDTLNGNQGNDNLNGGDGNDNLTGGAGNDLLAGNAGDDSYRHPATDSAGSDTIDEAPGAGIDTIDTGSITLTSPLELGSAAPQAVTSLLTLQLAQPDAVEWLLAGARNDSNLTSHEIYTVPGPTGTTTRVTFKYGGASAAYKNDVFVYECDAEGNRLPIQTRTLPLFTGNVTLMNSTIDVLYKAGTKLSFYIEQNGGPRIFYALPSKNDDGDHVSTSEPRPGEIQYEWEDLHRTLPNPSNYKWDGDNNDLVMSVAATKLNVPVVSIQAIDSVAHEAYRDTGTYVITRESGNIDESIPMEIIVSGDATYRFHYELSPDLPPLAIGGDDHRSTITLLPGVEKLYVHLTPLVEDSFNTLTKATIAIQTPQFPIYAIEEGYEEATVRIIPANQQGDLTITGRITYEGAAGSGTELTLGTFPVRGAKVEIYDENGSFAAELVGTAYTDDNGRYEVRISSIDTVTFGEDVDPYIVAVAKSAPQDVVSIAHEASVTGDSPAKKRFVDAADVTSHGPGSVMLDGAIRNATDENINGAFSIFDAMYSFARYHWTLPGVEPTTVKGQLIDTDDTSYYNDGTLYINKPSRFNWDTIGHEYGHFAHHYAGVELPGRGEISHYLSRNLRYDFGRDGWTVAFTEGFATYFSLVAQANTPKPPDGVAGFGDTEYWSTENLTVGVRTDIEAETVSTGTGFGAIFGSLGEDNEVSVFRVLWDLYDPTNDDPIGDIGDVGVWALVVGGEARELPTFYSLYRNLTAGANPERVWDIGRILALHHIVPEPLGVDFGAAATLLDPPTFKVSTLYGARNEIEHDKWLFSRVEIRFYSVVGNPITVAGGAVIPAPAGVVSEVSWTPTADQWADLLAGLVDRWSVVVKTATADGTIREYESFASALAFV